MKKVPWYLPLEVAAIVFGGTYSAHSARNNQEFNLNNRLSHTYVKKGGWLEFFQKFQLFKDTFDPQFKKNKSSLDFKEGDKSRIQSFRPPENSFDINQSKERLEVMVSKEKPFVLRQSLKYKKGLEELKSEIEPQIEEVSQKIDQYKDTIRSIKSANTGDLIIKCKAKLDKIKERVSEQEDQFFKLKPDLKNLLALSENYDSDLGKLNASAYPNNGTADYFKEFKQQYDQLVSDIKSIAVERLKEEELSKKKNEAESKWEEVKGIVGKPKLINDSGMLIADLGIVYVKVDTRGDKKHPDQKTEEFHNKIRALKGYNDAVRFYQSIDGKTIFDDFKNSLAWEFGFDYSKYNKLRLSFGQPDLNFWIKVGDRKIPFRAVDEFFKAHGINTFYVTSSNIRDLKYESLGEKRGIIKTMFGKELFSFADLEKKINRIIYLFTPPPVYGDNKNTKDWQTTGYVSSHKMAEHQTNSMWVSIKSPKFLGIRVAFQIGKTNFYIKENLTLGADFIAQGEKDSIGLNLIKNYRYSNNLEFLTTLGFGMSSIKKGDIEAFLGLTNQYSIFKKDLTGESFPYLSLGSAIVYGPGKLSLDFYPGINLGNEISPKLSYPVFTFSIDPFSLSYNPFTKLIYGAAHLTFSSDKLFK